MAASPLDRNQGHSLSEEVVSDAAAASPRFGLPGQISSPAAVSAGSSARRQGNAGHLWSPAAVPASSPEGVGEAPLASDRAPGTRRVGLHLPPINGSDQVAAEPRGTSPRRAKARARDSPTARDTPLGLHYTETMGQLTERPVLMPAESSEQEVEDVAAPAQGWGLYAAVLAASGLAWLASKHQSGWTGVDVALACIYLACIGAMLAVCLSHTPRPARQLRVPPLLLSSSLLALAVVEAKSRLASSQTPAAAWGAACAQAGFLQCLAMLLPGACGCLLASGTVTVALAAAMAIEGQLLAVEISQCLLLPAAAMCAAAWLAADNSETPCQGRCLQLRTSLRDFVLGRAAQDSHDVLATALVELIPTSTPSTKAAMVEFVQGILARLKCADLPPPLKSSLRLIMKNLLEVTHQAFREEASPLLPQSLDNAPEVVQDYILDLLPDVAPRRPTGSVSGCHQAPPRVSPSAHSFDQHMAALLQPLLHQEPGVQVFTDQQTASAQQLLATGLGQWGFDMFSFAAACGKRPLHLVGQAALHGLVLELRLNSGVLQRFLEAVESRYRSSNPYHNSMHAADVLNSMVYFFGLRSSSLPSLPPLEQLAALTAAASHDVGHDGFSNRFHSSAETPLAQLFNDQSCLENMHAAIAVALLKSQGTNFLEPLPPQEWSAFRSNVVTMILDTDLGKHFSSMATFKKDFLDGTPSMDNPKHRQQLLGMVIKACDVSGSAKPFALHARWATLVNAEFFRQGDLEKELGFPPSPFCDRLAQNVADSQKGFYEFIALPLLTSLNDHLQSRRLALEVLPEAKMNQKFWQEFESSSFNYQDPVANVPMLVRKCTKDRSSFQLQGQQSEGGVRAAAAAPVVKRQVAPRCNTTSHGVTPSQGTFSAPLEPSLGFARKP